ncbi:AMP-binding protein [Brevundimonas sp.]|uniref:AMP-binding protein n=1 Tax=Brevundimonas sp. TaxID=1871086 RepID=UPI0035AFD857
MTSGPVDLGARLFSAARRCGERIAVRSGPVDLTYDELLGRAGRVASSLRGAEGDYVGVLTQRGVDGYIAIHGTVLAGKAWAPLNPALPDDRLAAIIEAAGLTTVVCDDACSAIADRLADRATRLTVVRVDGGRSDPVSPPRRSASDPAYLLFTSGSTGAPKGVSVSHGNLAAYLDDTVATYAFCPDDVHSQTFEFSFDLSVHDMMCAWSTGGALAHMPATAAFAAGRFIVGSGITCWFSVPSLAILMQRTKALTPGAFPNLRTSLFCGEALPASVAAAWHEAAPKSRVDNLYGPTEATIAISRHTVDGSKADDGIVPIGRAFSGQTLALIDAEARLIEGEGQGELVLGGSQLTGRYFQNPEETERRYFEAEGSQRYRTGDLARRDGNGVFHFLGRMDSQIKFNGLRIELGDIEHAGRRVSGSDELVAIARKDADGVVTGLALVIAGPQKSAAEIREGLAALLPRYMIPATVKLVDVIPKNLNGKFDRAAASALLESER